MKKVCIVSGGSGGLGLEIAVMLLKRGKNVLILGRSNEKLHNALKKLKNFAGENIADSYSCNIGNESDIRDLSRYLTDHHFITEYLFNNAGRVLDSKADTSTSDLIDAVFEANLKGMILLTGEVLKLTPDEEELSIVNIMSTSALTGRANETIYCAAKWGARGYTEALRTELKGKKRNIIAVYPGGMKTGFWDITDKNRDISGFMNPSEVAEKIVNAVMVTSRLSVTDLTINRK